MITLKVQPWQVVKAVYDMCKPVGMGYLQFTPGAMTEAQAIETLAVFTHAARDYRDLPKGTQSCALDYVGGRQCKLYFTYHPDTGCTFDDTFWYDHTSEDLMLLIETLQALEASNG